MDSTTLRYRVAAVLLAQLPLRPVDHLYSRVPPRPGPIPNVVWQTWDDPRLGRTHARYLTRFRTMNPGWSFVLVDNAGCDAYMQRHYAGHPILEVYRSARIGPLRTDIWRYALLLREGGVYCDVNKMMTVPLDDLIAPNDHAVIAAEDTPLVQPDVSWQTDPLPEAARGLLQHPDFTRVNWFLAFAPGHPFLARALERIVETAPAVRGRPFDDVKAAVVDFTGPRMFTRAIADVLARDPAVPFTQAGTNFHGLGDQNIRYSWVRYLQRRSYRHLPGQVIVA
jgi:mannosyltransferase OCH1-like enzyme